MMQATLLLIVAGQLGKNKRKTDVRGVHMLSREEYYNDNLILPPECDVLCPYRRCFHKYEDKGSFSQGVGYTSYNKEFKPVCATRQAQGCPDWRDGKNDQANLPRALEAGVNLIKMHQSARSKKDIRNRQRGYDIIEAVAKLLAKMRLE